VNLAGLVGPPTKSAEQQLQSNGWLLSYKQLVMRKSNGGQAVIPGL